MLLNNHGKSLPIKQIVTPTVPMWAKMKDVDKDNNSFTAYQPVVLLCLYVDEDGDDAITGLMPAGDGLAWSSIEEMDNFEAYTTKLPESAVVWD